MKLSEYDDEDLIEEIKHRGIKIDFIFAGINMDFDDKTHQAKTLIRDCKVLIGDVEFELTK